LVENTTSGELIRLARKVNDQRPIIVAEQTLALLNKVSGTKVGILGVAYKANVDDCRETPAEPILKRLETEGLSVKYHDPHVSKWQCDRIDDLTEMKNWADVMVMVTGHECYKELKSQESIIDSSGLLKPVK